MNNVSINIRDYSLVGAESKTAVEKGLADAKWYQTPVPREKMRELLVRKNGPAVRDTLLWFGLIFGSGFLVYFWWGTWLAVFPYIVYSVLYASTSDARWHEAGHGTAFRTRWMNDVLYEISSFMVFRQSTVWRWSHARHHSDTIIRGRDPEIAVPRPPKISNLIIGFFGLRGAIPEMKKILLHSMGKIDPEVATYLPESEYRKVIRKARLYLVIFLAVIFASIALESILPLMYVGLPTLLGSWLLPVYGYTQHAGLQENVLDHRLNSRTVYMNRIHRFLYLNMNYHIEHHMFPLVPYHALPRLHELVKDDYPEPSKSIMDAYREIIPAVLKQIKDPSYFTDRKLPENAGRFEEMMQNKSRGEKTVAENGKIEVCTLQDLPKGEVLRFDFEHKTYALYRTKFDNFYATDGICTHGNAHLAEGVVIDEMIECAKHNGRFSLKDGSPARIPVCNGINTYKVELIGEKVVLDAVEIRNKQGGKEERKFRVISNKNVGTFIKELELEPIEEKLKYEPGQYIQLTIPPHNIKFRDFEIDDKFLTKWEEQHLFESWSMNEVFSRRNYSLATNPSKDPTLRFNIRIFFSPDLKSVSAGTGSSYVFNLRAGDEVKLAGPFGDFLVKDTGHEKVYLGGGAGMAPIRSHLSYLFETLRTDRKVSYWYGARSLNDLFYVDYFRALEKEHPNFTFKYALSEPDENDNWTGYTGFIHRYLLENYLSSHPDLSKTEFYLCGPPAMVRASKQMLTDLKVKDEMIAFDEF